MVLVLEIFFYFLFLVVLNSGLKKEKPVMSLTLNVILWKKKFLDIRVQGDNNDKLKTKKQLH